MTTHGGGQIKDGVVCVSVAQTDIFSGALFIQVSLGWDLYLSTGVLLVVTAAYTVAGKHGHTPHKYSV